MAAASDQRDAARIITLHRLCVTYKNRSKGLGFRCPNTKVDHRHQTQQTYNPTLLKRVKTKRLSPLGVFSRHYKLAPQWDSRYIFVFSSSSWHRIVFIALFIFVGRCIDCPGRPYSDWQLKFCAGLFIADGKKGQPIWHLDVIMCRVVFLWVPGCVLREESCVLHSRIKSWLE